jgi:hypothetical protein
MGVREVVRVTTHVGVAAGCAVSTVAMKDAAHDAAVCATESSVASVCGESCASQRRMSAAVYCLAAPIKRPSLQHSPAYARGVPGRGAYFAFGCGWHAHHRPHRSSERTKSPPPRHPPRMRGCQGGGLDRGCKCLRARHHDQSVNVD